MQLSIGTLAGALGVAPIADRIGRKPSMSFWSLIFSIGVVVQMAAIRSWQQVAVGRLISGAGVGALSILVPMYVSETGPRQVRGSRRAGQHVSALHHLRYLRSGRHKFRYRSTP